MSQRGQASGALLSPKILALLLGRGLPCVKTQFHCLLAAGKTWVGASHMLRPNFCSFVSLMTWFYFLAFVYHAYVLSPPLGMVALV